MWKFASHAIAGNLGPKLKIQAHIDSSDDELSPCALRKEGLECPICFESFNIVENVPYVLWCGHTLCKNCVLGLQWAVVKFPTLPIQLPLFISCPWCHLLSLRLVYKGTLKLPRKNFFLLWIIESMNNDRFSFSVDRQLAWNYSSGSSPRSNIHQNQHNFRRTVECAHPPDLHPDGTQPRSVMNVSNMDTINTYLQKSLVFFVHLTAKFPLVLIFLLIVLYAVPASAVFLALYLVVTILFAVPSFLILYFAYPSLDWLLSEIIT